MLWFPHVAGSTNLLVSQQIFWEENKCSTYSPELQLLNFANYKSINQEIKLRNKEVKKLHPSIQKFKPCLPK